MASILNTFKKFSKRRKYIRYNVRNDTFVNLVPGKQKVQMVDISLGGAAFIYNGRPEDLNASEALNLPNLQRLHFDTVSDISAPGYAQSPDDFRRCGVKFKWIGATDKAELSRFIEEFRN
ncbi:MAG: PilZ domain-containing protein [Desulfobacteraceae bacterium]|nr:MAG: PilZ domain-containing protein [Desulfobacteraceae bacterium]